MAQPASPQGGRRERNARIALILGGVVCAMIALAFAAVPLYRLFCQVTGYGGTTQVAESLPETSAERVITVRFDATVHPGLPWSFQPEERQIALHVGESGLVFYKAKNLADHLTAGTATFNVTPLKAGQYFNKVACFCFDEQQLKAGEEIDMGVSFFVDPAILDDRNLDDVTTITLSYTFFADEEAFDAEASDGETSGEEASAERPAIPAGR